MSSSAALKTASFSAATVAFGLSCVSFYLYKKGDEKDKQSEKEEEKERQRQKQNEEKGSYKAPYYEDRWVESMLVTSASKKKKRFFIDVGAGDGIMKNRTYYLERGLGWKGICAEPSSLLFKKLKQNRSCTCLHAAVGAFNGQTLFMEDGDMCANGKTSNPLNADDACIFRAGQHDHSICRLYGPCSSSSSSSSSSTQNNHNMNNSISINNANTLVPIYTLDRICESNKVPKTIDYMSIDVDGDEFNVLSGFSFSRYSVRLLTVQHYIKIDMKKNQVKSSNTYEQIAPLLLQNKYVQANVVRDEQDKIVASWWIGPKG